MLFFSEDVPEEKKKKTQTFLLVSLLLFLVLCSVSGFVGSFLVCFFISS